MPDSPMAHAADPPALTGWHLQLSADPGICDPAGHRRPLAPRDALLLAWLALEGATPRAQLARLMWPHSADDSARNSLRQRLFKLRSSLGIDLVQGSGTHLALAAGLAHDLARSDGLLGDLAPDLGPELDAWLQQQRERLRVHARRALRERCQAAEDAGDWSQALLLAGGWLALDPWSEEVHARLMRLHYLAGDRTAALLAFDRCERALKDEVGTRPGPATLTLLAQIEAAADLPGSATARGHALTPRQVPATVLRPPHMIGREAELAALQQAWTVGQVVVITGEAGLGKSRLLQEFAAQRSVAASCIRIAARPGDGNVPWATLARLLQALEEAAPAAAPLEPPGLDVALPHAPAMRLQRQRLVQATLWRWSMSLPRAVSAAATLLLDDLHFADAASLDLLHGLIDAAPDAAAAPARRALRWVLAYRHSDASTALHALQDGLIEQARLHALALHPLTLSSLAQLVDSLALPGVEGAALAPGLMRRTGGNPLFVLETLKQAWVERSLAQLADARRLPRPLSVTRLIERRLTQLSPQALALARCAAVAGEAFSVALAMQVLHASALAIADAWAELEAAQILRDQAFVHDLYQEAALQSVPAAVARQLHGDIAQHLERSDDPVQPAVAAATLAEHWMASTQPQRAVPHLQQAARAAAQAGDTPRVARCWRQLADLQQAAGQAEAAFASAQQAVNALRELGTGDELARAIDHLAALAVQPRQRAAACEERGVMHHMRGESALAAAAVVRGLAELDALGPQAEPLVRLDLLNLQGIVLRRAGRLDESGAALRQALAIQRMAASAGAAEAGRNLPAVLNNLALVLQDQDDHLGAIGLLQESAALQTDPLVRARVLNNLGLSLEDRGQVALAYEQRLAAARLLSQVEEAGLARLNLALSLGANAHNLGRFGAAIAHLDEARDLLASCRHRREDELHRQYASLWLKLGRFNLARESLERAEQLAGADAHQRSFCASVRARLLLALHQDARPVLEAAEATLRQAGEQRYLRRLLVCKAQVVPPNEALLLMRELSERPELRDNAAAQIAPQVRMAQALLALGRVAEARRHAQRAADWLAALQPMDLSPAEVWHTLALAARADGDVAAANAAAHAGRQWLQWVQREHLDAQFHDSWLRNDPFNAGLMAMAAATAT